MAGQYNAKVNANSADKANKKSHLIFNKSWGTLSLFLYSITPLSTPTGIKKTKAYITH